MALRITIWALILGAILGALLAIFAPMPASVYSASVEPTCPHIVATSDLGHGLHRVWCEGGTHYDVALRGSRKGSDGVPTPGPAYASPWLVDAPGNSRTAVLEWRITDVDDHFAIIAP